MRALVVYCHPRPESFTAAVRDLVLERLESAGAEVRVSDLYAMSFDPVLSGAELAAYEDLAQNRRPIASHAEDVLWCDTLVFVYPTWWFGMPAVLKGWLDRVMVPGLSFHLPETGRTIRPGLTHITRLGVFTTCGASWLVTRWVGAPGRRTLLRGLAKLCAPRLRTAFAAHYLMDSSTPESRARHLKRVDAAMTRFLKG